MKKLLLLFLLIGISTVSFSIQKEPSSIKYSKEI